MTQTVGGWNLAEQMEKLRQRMFDRVIGWKSPLYAVPVFEIFLVLLYLATLMRWNSPDLNIPTLYLLLYLFQAVHCLSPFALITVLFDSINFFMMGVVAVIYGVALFLDVISFIWRAVCLAYEGSLTCPSLSPGRWLAGITLGANVVFVLIDLLALVCLIMYIRRLKVAQIEYLGAVMSSQFAMASATIRFFTQRLSLINVRSMIRGLLMLDLYLLIFTWLLRLIEFYGAGTWWWIVYLQVPHLWYWVWLAEVAGSVEAKLYIATGGSDASQSEGLTTLTFWCFLLSTLLDGAVLFFTIWDSITTFFVANLLEDIGAWFLIGFAVLMVAFDIVVVVILARLLHEHEVASIDKNK